jgi:RNAse (barnase) inhibitor barstar
VLKKSKVFKYFDNSSQIPKAASDTFIGTLPKGISDVTELFEALFAILLLPGYFGFNWDALSDCLRDFHWLKEKTIVLVHKELPQLSEGDLWEYLDVLYECITDWCDDEEHMMAAWFPEDCKGRIIDLIG